MQRDKKQTRRHAHTRGVTLLFAILTISLLLTVGLAIFNIAFKETILARFAKDSRTAFFAASTGAECAIYYDRTDSDIFRTPGGPEPISCARDSATVETQSGKRVFTLDLGDDGCAEVEVEKTGNNVEIISQGTNLACNTTSRLNVQRGIRVTY